MRRTTGNIILVLSAIGCFGVSTILPNPTLNLAMAKSSVRAQMEPKEFDRLDGHGPTGKKVDVIEWENNLEIHVYPKGALRSLGMKVDRTNKDKPVMVIEYGFHGTGYTLIRRALLSIPMKDGFKTYQDPSTEEYDKVIISNNTLVEGVRPYVLAAAPTQLYPDHHPALAQEESTDSPSSKSVSAVDEPAKTYQRKTASEGGSSETAPKIQLKKASEFQQDSQGTTRRRAKDEPAEEGERIRNFAF